LAHPHEIATDARPGPRTADWLLVFMLLTAAAGFLSVAVSQLALGLALLVLLQRWVIRHRRPAATGLEGIALALALWALAMVPLSTDVSQSALYYRRFYLFTAIWTAASCATSETRRRWLLGFLLGGAMVTCLHDQVRQVLATGGLFAQRMSQTFNSMTSGALLMMAILVAVGFVLAPGTGRRLRLLLGALLPVLLVGMLMTMTRSAQMGLAAGVGAILLAVRPRLFGGFLALVVAVVTVTALWGDHFLSDQMWARVNPQYVMSGKDTDLRLEMWHGGWEMVRRHPVTGLGDRGLEEISPQYYTSDYGIYFGHLHSNIVHMAAIWGVPGVLLGQAFIFAGLWLLLRRWRALRRLPGGAPSLPMAAGWALGGIGVWAGFFVAGLTEWYFGDAEPMLVYLTILGIALAPLAGASNGHQERRAADC
jgi:O-antigen ligase